MRWTANKLRNLLLESNYKLPKGYSVLKRSRSLNGNMSLSFLSGDAGMNPVKAFEARAYAKDSARKLKRAIQIEKDNMEIGLLGLDEIGNKQARQQRKQERKQARQDRKAGSPAPSMPQSEGDSGEGLEPTAPTTGGGSRKEARQQKRQVRRQNRIDRKSPGRNQGRQSRPSMTDLVRKGAGLLPGQPLSPDAQNQVDSAEQSAGRADQASQEATQGGGGLFRGRNLLIFGISAVVGIGIIYFLNKKK
jgi:hypothetical protein